MDETEKQKEELTVKVTKITIEDLKSFLQKSIADIDKYDEVEFSSFLFKEAGEEHAMRGFEVTVRKLSKEDVEGGKDGADNE